jgi:hypothetical protein
MSDLADLERKVITRMTDKISLPNFYEVNMRSKLEALELQLSELDKYFTSGNVIPVERATILAKDYWKIRGRE